ncbi:hypothetical protein [uncultured Desulfobacter sp.]|uniref:hypothetical protein n=1 Tax=uncultured Desulfobacter sp. TaxID=240139 RepID=UPI0029F55253|nr:hypothetical protein [uncultured Desulfobacter sp.]
MSNIILLVVRFLAGIMLRKISQCPANTPEALNGFIIYISLPSLALYHIHTLAITRELIYTGLMAWILFGLGAFFFYFTGKKLKLSRATIGALVLTGGLGNTSFVGLPMISRPTMAVNGWGWVLWLIWPVLFLYCLPWVFLQRV